ncbi:M14 family metallopeptidase [Mitsuaria sp. WAJ17]|uniref:M14 family metallopeptidase n=1 Tax=Mitsuaria sp. WAJ17 TaxID=2761452 RepID=UPI001602BDCB|nr:M14 family metallopeptidase [Mitsuaria sp. WAJ17]MBB2486742.1 M14 family metallopeptidase [Mitsuaria sp. WAJ17]
MPLPLPSFSTRRLNRALLLALLALPGLSGAAPDLDTEAQRSGFLRTGRYEEVGRLCQAFQQRFPRMVRCTRFGSTPQGRPMWALVASQQGVFSPAEARRRGLPVTLIQGGIHAGEIDGKDAGFLALRQVLQGQAAAGALKRQVLVFVPVFNVDGHERFGAWNRPNQRGPEAMGWRTTAQNYNLNRDYAKADAPEMQAMLRLVQAWDPLATIDLHVTDGAQFQHDVSIQVEPVHAGDEVLRASGQRLRDGVIEALAAQGSLPQPFYMAFEKMDNPASGFADGVPPPRFSTGYFWLRNRFGMLVETHSWKDYPTRVRITRNTVVAVMALMARHGQDWLAQARAADLRAMRLAGSEQPLAFEASPKQRMIDFRGYAYTRTPSEISGALMTRYDESRPEIWHVPLRDEIVPALSLPVPGAGYLVPAAHAEVVAAKLRLHGLRFERLAVARQALPVQVFRAEQARFGAQSVEGHQRLEVKGQWRPEPRELPAGSLFVPAAQPGVRLLMALLEPQAPDSFLAWGFFNNAFETKEYMEDYVAEEVARAQLAADPQLAAEFQRRLAEDAAFAADPRARLAFFARRHASWDERYRLYPVMRLDQPLR